MVVKKSDIAGKIESGVASKKAGAANTGKKADEGLGAIAKYYDLSPENLTVGMILHKMSEVLEVYLKVIQQILQPEEFHSLHECIAFDDAEKSKMFELYRRIIITHREILRSLILNDLKDSLSTIKFVHSEILGVKPMMIDVVKKMQHSWKTYSKDSRRGTMQYFG